MCNMKTIRVPRGEGWKRLESLIRYQLDNFSDFELESARWISEEIKINTSLTKEEIEDLRGRAKELLKTIGDFSSLAKKMQEGIEVEATDDEISVFQECIKNQLELSEARLKDFREDRFGWGNGACQTLIDDETIFYN